MKYSISQIKKHPNFPFTDFETSPVSFLMIELYWSQLFTEIISEYKQDWKPVGKAQIDGNPIFGSESKSLHRSVRIIQKINVDNMPSYPTSQGENTHYPLQAWLDRPRVVPNSRLLSELVLYADISSEAEEQCKKMLIKYCIQLASLDDMESFIANYEKQVGMPD